MSPTQLTSEIDLARRNGVRFPNEGADYRHARDKLLAEEIELRRHMERGAGQQRALPPGGWHNLRLYSDVEGDFTRDYVSADDADVDVHIGGDMKVAWFKDPDGNILNLVSR